jgi:hypothetical protein
VVGDRTILLEQRNRTTAQLVLEKLWTNTIERRWKFRSNYPITSQSHWFFLCLFDLTT